MEQLLSAVTTADGRTLTVREGGDPDGVPVLVHHGTPGSSLLYRPHVHAAEEAGVRLFSYDRPGYGSSSRMPGRNVADCAADVSAICDALEIGRFCVWGASGGGPHALATAALLPDRVAAAAVIASIAPYTADGLVFTDGMGETNIESFEAIVVGGEAHQAQHEKNVAAMLAANREETLEFLDSLLGPADRAVLTGSLVDFMFESTHAGIVPSAEGWFDDGLVWVGPWGFDLDSIRVPVLYWHGEQDKFVPFSHGVWLAEHIPGAEARLSPDDGHLTILELRYAEVQSWLLDRFPPEPWTSARRP
jgi:pimeloyl-ACP methyl ester carboxylesterase